MIQDTLSIKPLCRYLLAVTFGLSFLMPANYAFGLTLTWGATGAGGTGTWNTTTANWFDGTSSVIWTNAPVTDAVFGGTAGTVTLGVPITVGNMTFNTGGYTITGSTLTLAGPSGSTVSSPTGLNTISSLITGNVPLTISGAGTTQITNSSNNWVGSLTVKAGSSLRLGAGNVIPSTTDVTIESGAHVYTVGTYSETFKSLNGSGLLDNAVNPGTTVWYLGANNGSGSFSGTIGNGPGTIAVAKNGTGTQIMVGPNNTYHAQTILNGGILSVDSITNGGAASGIGMSNASAVMLQFNGGTLQYTGAGASTDRLFTLYPGGGGIDASGTGPLNFTNTGANAVSGSGNRTLTLSGTNTGANTISSIIGDSTTALAKSGPGTWLLTGANTYAGGTTFNGGILKVSADANLGAATGPLTFNGGTLQWASAFNLAGSRAITLNAGGGTLDPQSFNTTIASTISGSGPLTKIGSGTVTLTGANTSTGGTTISTGILQVGNGVSDSSLGTGPIVDNAALVFDPATTISVPGNISGTGPVTQNGPGTTILTGTNTYTGGTTISAGTLQLGNGGTNGSIVGNVTDNGNLAFNRSDISTFAGIISGTGTVTQNGSGTTILTSTNTYTGGTNLNVGDLQVSADANLGNPNGPLNFNGGELQWGSSFNLSATRAITLNSGGGAFDTQQYTSTISQPITGVGAMTKEGSGTLTLTGASTYSGGTTIEEGTLQLGNGGMTGSIVGNVTDNGNLAFNRSDISTFPGIISGTGTVTQNGTGTTILTGTNTYTGGTTISAGTLQVGNGVSDGSLGTGPVVDNASLVFDPATTITIPGNISGTGTVTQTGSGTTILTGTNTYTGGTTISGGTLQLGNGGMTGSIVGNVADNGNLAFNRSDTSTFAGTISGTGTVTQNGSGTTVLTGPNTYSGATNVNAGSLYINGNQSGATGLITVANNATIGGTGTIGGSVNIANGGALEPGSVGGVIGTLTINGNLGLNSGSILNYNFGQANVPGGALNDLTNVGGNLTLAGTLNVDLSPGGTFSPGLYRIFNYAGTLTNNGLIIGSMPPGTTEYVQTSVPHQVNLVNTTGVTLNYWDGSLVASKNNGVVDGGNGVWQNTTGNDNWADPTGAINAPYTDSAFAIFENVPGTVTVDNSLGQVISGGMQFAVNGYHIVGSPITLVETTAGSGQTAIRVGDGTPASAGMATTIDTVLQGSTQLVKVDAGTLVLNAANTYSGGTAINGGTLAITNDNNLGAASGGLSFNGGELETRASITSPRNITLNSGGGTIDTEGNSSTFSGIISGSGQLTIVDGGSIVTLSGINTYTGGTLITGGAEVAISNNASLGTGTLTLGDATVGDNPSGPTTGGTVITNAPAVTLSQNVILGVNSGTFDTNGFNSTIGGVISGTGGLTKAGAGVLTLTGSDTYTGGTTVSAGRLRLGDGTTDGSIVGNVSNNAILEFNPAGTMTFSGTIFGPGVVEQGGFGTTILTGTNTYSGGTTIVRGTLQLGNGGTTGSIVGNVTDNGNLAFDRSDTSTFAGIISGTGTVTQNGSGTTILTGTNTYTGGTNFNAGDLQISTDANLGDPSGPLTFNGGDLQWGNSFNLAGSRAITLNAGGGTFDTQQYTTTISQPITGVGAMAKEGSGSLILTGANTYTGGTTISAGTLQLGNGGTTGSIVGNVTDNSNLVFNRSDTSTFAGIISGTGTVTQNGSGTTILTGTNTYTGGTTISTGTLQLGNGGTTGSIVGNITDNGNLVFNRSDTSTFAGIVSGTGTVTQNGSGSTVLTGANTYTGPTTVSAGSLYINGNQSAATAPTTVASGATLGGSGTIGGDVMVNAGGTLAPSGGGVAGAPTTLNINGSLNLNSASTLNYQFGQANVPGGALNDLTNVGGNLTLDGTLNVTLSPGGTFSPGLYRIFNYAGTLTDNGLIIGSKPPGTTEYVQTSVPHQVNLVNTTGVTLNYWDGSLAANKNNGVVDGGNGVWQNSTGNDNWADPTGAINMPYADSAFSIFENVPGTVTVDNSLGQVMSGGMQFAVDGYHIVGSPITLVETTTGSGQTVIRVGDGTTAGASMTTTIDTVLQGSTQLVKVDAGTLVLNAANTYSGGTAINGGTLAITNDNNLGAASGDLSFDTGELETRAPITSSRNITLNAGGGTIDTEANSSIFSGIISGSGQLTIVDGGSIVTLSGINTYTGGTLVTGGAEVAISNSANLGTGTLTLGDATVGDNPSGPTTGGTVITNAPVTLSQNVILGVNSGTFDTNGFNSTISSVISGQGGLTKAGAGVLTLTGTDTYTGGTTITAGALQLGDGGTSGSILGDVANNGSLIFNRSDTNTFAGVISGIGDVSQIGTGTTTLTGNSTYSGGTTISAGALQLGDGGTSGSILGDVANNGSLIFNRSDTNTFPGVISGIGDVSQIGTGTTILTGNSTYSGGTTISAGALQLGDGGTSGSIMGDVANNGSLIFNRSDTNTFSGVISGTGDVQQIGSGTTILSGANTYSGRTEVANGTLAAGTTNTFSPNSSFDVLAGGTLDLGGFDQTINGLTNAGLVTMGTGTRPGTRLTTPNYVGVSGRMVFNTVLSGDGAPSDVLVIDGGRGTGTTSLQVVNVGGGGALTTQNGILLVDAINGATTDPDAFSLGSPVVAGPYEYELEHGGINGSNPDNWYLRSIGLTSGGSFPYYAREVSLAAAVPSMALMYDRALLGTLHNRVGEQEQLSCGRNITRNAYFNGGWVRAIYQNGTHENSGIYYSGPSFDYRFTAFQVGFDLYHNCYRNGDKDFAGVMGAFGNGYSNVEHKNVEEPIEVFNAGRNRLNAWSLGGYYTYYSTMGWYVDSVLQGTTHDMDSDSKRGFRTFNERGNSITASLESGYNFSFPLGIGFEPELQLAYERLKFDNTNAPFAKISFEDTNSLVGRVGARMLHTWEFYQRTPMPLTAWLFANLWHEFKANSRTNFSSANGNVPFPSRLNGSWTDVGAAASMMVSKTISIYASGSYDHYAGSHGHAYGGSVGVRMNLS